MVDEDITPDVGALREQYLKDPVSHMDITKFNPLEMLAQMEHTRGVAGDLYRAATIFQDMIKDPQCTVILTLAGSSSAAGCMQVYSDMVKYDMVDAVVATGASVVDMDFFEALGFKHFKGSPNVNDGLLSSLGVDRIYDVFISESDLRVCDQTICDLADGLEPRVYSAREFIRVMGKHLTGGAAEKDGSLLQVAYEKNVPIFCPAFADSSAGMGLVKHQVERLDNMQSFVEIGMGKEFRELTHLKGQANESGLFMVGGGVPKNFAQDTVVACDLLRNPVPMHKYAVQVTVADPRDGACSSSTLSEACSWGKVSLDNQQMVFSEASLAVPIIVSAAYHANVWRGRDRKELSKLLFE